MEKFEKEMSYQICVVDTHPYIYIDDRVDPASIPDGYEVYEVAGAEGEDIFARIGRKLRVDFFATIIGKHALPLTDGTYYPPFGSEEYEGVFIGKMTPEEYDAAVSNPDYAPEQFANTKEVRDGTYAASAGHRYAVMISTEAAKNGEETGFAEKALEALDVAGFDAKAEAFGDTTAMFTATCREDIRIIDIRDIWNDRMDAELSESDIGLLPIVDVTRTA